MAGFKKTRNRIFTIAFSLASIASPVFAQNHATTADNSPGAEQTTPADVITKRVNRQHLRVNHALKAGLITDEQAQKLRASIDEIALDAADKRQKNNGEIKPEDLTQIENSLNQSSEEIRSAAEAGHARIQSGQVLGPKWTPGLDGAQNPKRLLQEMKKENQRELRQERQNTEQKIEQQQLEYEREMTNRLSDQREDVLKQKEELKEIRKDAGAD